MNQINNQFNVSSFVIRFIHTTPDEDPFVYRGSIRHVQSNEEIQFSAWDEAEAFLMRFVPLETKKNPKEHDSNET